MKSVRAAKLEKKDLIEVTLDNGAVLKSKTVVIATGARWRNLNVPGEQEFKNKGVAYCPHCDGPLFAGKQVAVVGGGNSGVEAAIDLAGVASHVTLFEFMPELKADQVLQERLYSLPNVTVHQERTSEGDHRQQQDGGDHATSIVRPVKSITCAMDGVFVQIGLVPNTEWLEGALERNRMGEIIVDNAARPASPAYSPQGIAPTALISKSSSRWAPVRQLH